MPSIHGSSPPAIITGLGEGEIETDAFNPPAESLIAIGIVAALPITDVSGGGLTWAVRAQRSAAEGEVEWWTAPNLTAQTGITITVLAPGLFTTAHIAVKAYVLTGADLTAPVGATGQGSSTTNNASVTGYTSTRGESRGLVAALEGNALGLPTSTDDESAFSEALSGLFAAKAADTSTLASVPFNLDAFGTSTPDWQWVAIEIQPPPVTKATRPMVSTAAVHRSASW